MKIQNILNSVAKTSASSKKLEILEKNKSNKVLRTIMFYTYNPFFNYFMRKVPKALSAGTTGLDTKLDSLVYLLDTLRSRKITGNAAREMVAEFLSPFNKISQEIIGRILNKDLKLGCSGSTANKIWKNFLPEFSVALAKKYEGKQDIFDGSWLTSRKLDGCRCIAIVEKGDVKFFSRNGKEFNTLDVLKKSVLSMIGKKDEFVLDGEICITDAKGNENFSSIMKVIRKKGLTIKSPKYYVFDMLTLDEFFSKKSKRVLDERQQEMEHLILNSAHTECLKQYVVTESTFAEMQEQVEADGWEGLIVRKNAPYKGKRSKDLLKVKKFFDAEYKVLETENSEMTFSEKGTGQVTYETMKSVVIEHKGYKVNVGSGWSREQRDLYYKSPKKIIGKTITVQYFEQTTNKQGTISLRFPTVKFVYENGRQV